MSATFPQEAATDMNERHRRVGAGIFGDIPYLRSRENLWLDDSGALTWGDVAGRVEEARLQCVAAGIGSGSVIVTPGDGKVEALAWLFGAAMCGATVAPLRQRRVGEAESWRKWFEVDWRVEDGRLVRGGGCKNSEHAEHLFAELMSRGHAGLILATGGTTGRPKLVLHDLESLLATVPVRQHGSKRVLPLLSFDHIGGLDIAWRALGNGHVIVSPPAEISPETVAAIVARHRVEVMPATPTMLNLLLLAGVNRTCDMGSLRVVPYGAEPMPLLLLEKLRAAFPGVDFVQRFGTSETGSVPVREGTGGLSLPEESKGFEWKVVDNELWVKSPARALGYLTGERGGFAEAGWFQTGDVAKEQPDGSINVRGRRQDMINIGGEKILPNEVEGLLLSHPFVEDCRVFSVPNAILGEVVAAEIVWNGTDRDVPGIKRALREHLPSAEAQRKLPAVVRLVHAVAHTANQKKARAAVP
jgi:acyl-CoA synthetase (AMP-forming)/AMP-acid ligase II